MNVFIRMATEDDADALFDLAKNFATSFTPERAAFETALQAVLADESANLQVAELDDELAGYCLGFDHFTFYANGRVSWVEEIAVCESYRRQGIGKALMDSFEEWGRARDSRLVGLATRRAAPFYTGTGYQESAIFFRKLL